MESAQNIYSRPATIQWRKAWSYAWKTIILIFLFQNGLLLLMTGHLNLLTQSFESITPLSLANPLVDASLIGSSIVALSGFIFASKLAKDRIKNALILGMIIGAIWGTFELILIIIQIIQTPVKLVDTSSQTEVSVLLFIPKLAIRNGIIGLIGGILAFKKLSLKKFIIHFSVIILIFIGLLVLSS